MGDPYKFGNHNSTELINRGKQTYGSKVDNSVCECPVCFGGKRVGLLACNNCKGTGKVENAKCECMECGATFNKSNPTSDTKCPKCGGYDIELANSKKNKEDFEKKMIAKYGKDFIDKMTADEKFKWEEEEEAEAEKGNKKNSRSEKIMDIDTSILDKHGKTSGRDLEQYRDEFLSQVRAAGINDITQEEADELEDQNYHTALGILMEARFLKRNRNSKYPSKGEIYAAWDKMSDDEKKKACKETGSFVEYGSLNTIGGSTQDVLEDWVAEHKLGHKFNEKDLAWKDGTSGKYQWQAKVYDEGSDYGINGGRVSKLWMKDTKSGEVVVEYDRGWSIGEDKKSIWGPIVDKFK